MKQLEALKEQLTSCVNAQIMNGIHNVDAQELGEAVDMIKDLAQAIYYCTVTEAMQNPEKWDNGSTMYYDERYPRLWKPKGDRSREREWDDGIMYYGGPRNMNPQSNSGYGDSNYNSMPRDAREGRSPAQRRNYMETKATTQDKVKQMKELEKYMQDLAKDVTEMIADATPEQKTMLKDRMNSLVKTIG